eukprot:gene8842-906_t
MAARRPPPGTPGYGPSVFCQVALTMLLTRWIVPQLGALLGVKQGLDVYIELLCAAAGIAGGANSQGMKVAKLSVVSVFVGYCGISLPCALLEFGFPETAVKLKRQGSKGLFTTKEFLQAITLSTVNLLFFSWMLTVPLVRLMLSIHGDAPRAEDPFDAGVEAAKFFTAPTAAACMFAHPLEFCFGNLMGVALGPVLTGCHLATCLFWYCYALVSTSCSHSGFWFLTCEGHDVHHEKFVWNFGAGGVMDAVFKTEHMPSNEAEEPNGTSTSITKPKKS